VLAVLAGGVGAPRARGVNRGRLNWALVALCLATAALSLPAVRSALSGQEVAIADPRQPHEAAAYLAAYPRPLRLFNALDWGGYLGWRLGPYHQLFVDGRLGTYPVEVFRDYFAISGATSGWEARLAAYGMDAIVASRDDQPALVQALAAPAAWRPVYCDAQAVVYLREDLARGREVACAAGA
jgi:hypothetical protein